MTQLTKKDKNHILYENLGISPKVYVGLDKQITISKILKTICTILKVEQSKLFSGSRKFELVQARQVAFYMTRRYTSHSFAMIAKLYVKDNNTVFNHATIIHGIGHIKEIRETDPGFDRVCIMIEAILEDRVSLGQWKLIKDQELIVNNLTAHTEEQMSVINQIFEELGEDFIPRMEELKSFYSDRVCEISLAIAELRRKRWKSKTE